MCGSAVRKLVVMSSNLCGPAVLFGLAGALTLAREVVGLADPAYYDPVTGLDYAAAWLTSLAGGVAAVALFVWWRRSPVRRGAWLLVIAAVAFVMSAFGNLAGDVFDIEVGDTFWTAGIFGFGATILAGAAALTVNDPYRWSGLFLIGYAAGWSFPDAGGLWLAGTSLIAMAYWITRASPATEDSPNPRP